MTNPIINPLSYPIIMTTQSNLIGKFKTTSCLEFGGNYVNISRILHFLVKGYHTILCFPNMNHLEM